MNMQEATKIAEGKTKVLYASSDGDAIIMKHKDALTAGDGARHLALPDKGIASAHTMDNVFRLLGAAQIETHYLERLDERHSLVRRCSMIPVEVVARRLAAGSYLRRHDVLEGTRFDPPLVELFIKNDALHDPLVTPDDLLREGIATREEVARLQELVLRVFAALEEAWSRLDVVLVDLKIECGRDEAGRLVVADIIDNDSWRLWPQGRRERMLDKQVYRELSTVSDEDVERIGENYMRVARMTDSFVTPAHVPGGTARENGGVA